MKQFNLPFYALAAILLACFCLNDIQAQVGINTTTPNGILDVTSTNQGVVLPRIALTATNSMAPATNPQSGSIPIGTVVYNTATTTTGSNDVSPGIYAWNGSWWRPQFDRKQSKLYESNVGIRVRSNTGFDDLSGLTGRTFTPLYSGEYRVEVTVNYGGGGAKVPNQGVTSDGNLNIGRQSGTFRLTFDGTNYDIPVHTYSTAYDGSVGATNYFAIWEEYTYVMYMSFNAGDVKTFTMYFDQDPAPEFISDGNSGTGRGYVAYDIPCTVEITYLGEN